MPDLILNTNLVCHLETLALYASRTFTLSALVDPEARGALTNTLIATANEADRTPARFVQTTPVTSVVDLVLKKMVTPTEGVLVGSPLTYTLIVTNAGPSAAMDVRLGDVLPTSLIYARSQGPALGECTEAAGVVTCTLGTLSPRSRAMVTLVVTSTATNPVSNTAYVQSREMDWASEDNADTVSVTGTDCVPISAVQLIRTPGGDLFTGNRLRFEAYVLESEASSPFTYTWTLDGKLLAHSGGVLNYTFTAPDDYQVRVAVDNACSQGQAPLSLSVEEPEPGQPDLSASYKFVSSRYVMPGERVTYTLALRNRANVTAMVTLEDPLPTSVKYVPDSVWSNSRTPAVFEDGRIRWSGHVISGTPVIIRFAVEILDLAPGTRIDNVATLADGYGNVMELATHSVYAPGYGISIQDGALYTRIPMVTLRLWWDAASIDSMFISNDGEFRSETGWLPVDAIYAGWELALSEDPLIPSVVYGKFRDHYGRQYATVQDDIIYDAIAPSVDHVAFIPETSIFRRQPLTPSTTAGAHVGVVRVKVRDANSGAARVQVSHDAGFTTGQVSAWHEILDGEVDIPWTLHSTGVVYIRAEDWAGNRCMAIQRTFEIHFDVYLPLVMKE
jgi:uncharacterized repeat protein (TIGR01451 family)